MCKNGKEEVINAGDAFYLPQGHTAMFDAGTELVVIAPEEQVKKVAPTIAHNYAVLQQGRQ